AIEAFIRRQLESPVQLFNSEEELASRIESAKRNVIAYILDDQVQPLHSNYYKSASSLREDCGFWLGSGDWILQREEQMHRNATIYFREPNKAAEGNFEYTGPLDLREREGGLHNCELHLSLLMVIINGHLIH
uniref:Uncharacterized protein n=1 Tax=Meloidogyne incognita TaxID=6306 RepID=A0A914P2B6_MELIC